MENYKIKKYGQTLSSAFGVYFNNGFWNNFGFGAIIMLAGIVFGSPYFWAVFKMTESDVNFTILIISYLILILGSAFILPPFAISYYGIKTKDYEDGKQSEFKLAKKQMFKNIGRVFGANAASVLCQLVIFAVLIALAGLLVISIFPVPFEDIIIWLDSVEPIDANELAGFFSFIGLFLLIMLVFAVLSFCVYIFFMFSGFIALFEGVKGFKAVIKSIKLACNKNFWITLGHIVLSYIIYVVSLNIISIPFYIGIVIITFTSMFYGSIVGVIIIFVMFTLAILCYLAVAIGIFINIGTILYFNAKARVNACEENETDNLLENKENKILE